MNMSNRRELRDGALWLSDGRGEGGWAMTTSSKSIAALETFLELRFNQFEDRSCLLLCDLMNGLSNRIVEQENITTRHLINVMDRVSALETGRDKNQHIHTFTPRKQLANSASPGVDSRSRTQVGRSA